MSVDEHRKYAPSEPIRFAILVVSSSRSLEDDRSGRRIAALVEAAGHEVITRTLAGDDVNAIRSAVRGLEEADVIVLTGGTGLAGTDVTPEALQPLLARRIDGFGELFRLLSFQQIGAAAMLSRAFAGVLPGGVAVFALPGSVRACELAMEELILPEIAHLVGLVRVSPGASVRWGEVPEEPVDVEVEPVDADADAEEDEDDLPALPPPSGRLGHLGGTRAGLSLSQDTSAGPAAGESEESGVPVGWQRALYEIGGEILRGVREELPQPIEKLAPVLNVLETAGEIAVLKLPSGVRYGLYGWPDLQRPSSKVLAVGWGQPLAEVLALHRYPVMTGTCIEERHGQLPGRDASVGEVCEAITGRSPADPSGELFAVSGDRVWIQRGNRVFRFDGRAERDDGNPKQVLATLLLEWHQR